MLCHVALLNFKSFKVQDRIAIISLNSQNQLSQVENTMDVIVNKGDF